jgi:hypothetical protein
LQLPGVGHDAGKMFASRQAFRGAGPLNNVNNRTQDMRPESRWGSAILLLS